MLPDLTPAQMLQVGMYALFAAEIYAWFVVGALSCTTLMMVRSEFCFVDTVQASENGHINVVAGIPCQGVHSFVQARLLDGALQSQVTRSEQES